MSFHPWVLSEALAEKRAEEVHFSRGFLRSEPAAWFSNLGGQWAPLFHLLSVNPKFISAQPRLEFPENLARLTSIEIDGEMALLGLDDHAVDVLASLISPALAEISADIFLEYIERRLCSTLRAVWTEEEPLHVHYLANGTDSEIDITAAIQVRLQLGEPVFDLWVGCGPKLTERLDFFARRQLQESSDPDFGDQVRTVSVELAELWVPPALLIDYMRSGTVIDLERPVTSAVRLLLDGEPWAEGTLCQSGGSLAVEVLKTDLEKGSIVDGSTRLSVVLCSTQLDLTGVRENHQPGAILPLGIALPASADIIIGGETVATAELGEINGRLAVQVQAMK